VNSRDDARKLRMITSVENQLDEKSGRKPYDMGTWVWDKRVHDWGCGSLALEQQ
jgi:hypothetical protein